MLHVMIVDDDEVVRDGLSRIIDWEKIGAKIVCAAKNGREAIETLKHTGVDFIISDIKMPEVDGLALIRYISEYHANIDTVLLSAYGEFEYAQEAIKCNVCAYILKPIDREKIEKITELVSNSSKEKAAALFIREKIHGRAFRDTLTLALRENDTARMKDILRLDGSAQMLNLHVIRDYYCAVVDTLFEFLEETGIKHISKSDIFKEIHKLGDFESIASFTEKKVEKILHLVNIEHQNQVPMLVEYIRDFIQQSYKNLDLNAGSIAEKFGFDLSYIGVLFKENYKTTITKYITALRMEEAKRLLRETRLSVYEVASRVGYMDHIYFSKKFRQLQGQSPAEYRNSKPDPGQEG